MTTTLLELAPNALVKHPKNPRHRAVADDELVESIKGAGIIQPLVAGPADEHGKHTIIAGHRRLDGAKKAKLKTVPVIVRDDLVTEGQQVEAMLIENGRREDLTPIEEAEGFHQLTLFGYKQKDIARATGRDAKTVSSRLRLLKLQKTTQNRVHKGQLTIENALAIAEFADDPTVTKELEKAAADGQGYNLKWRIQMARDRRKEEAEVAAAAADLRQREIPEVTPPKDAGVYFLEHVDGVTPIEQTPFRDPTEHAGCLTFAVLPPNDYSASRIRYGCTAEDAHDGQRSEAEKRRARERAEADREHEERQNAEAAAAAVRGNTLLEPLGANTVMPPVLRDLVRGLLPGVVEKLAGIALDRYQDALNIPDADRWQHIGWHQRDTTSGRANMTKLAGHVEHIDLMSDGVLTRALVAYLAAVNDDNLRDTHYQHKGHAARYLDLLEQLGHDFCDIDLELRAAVTGADVDEEAQAS